MYIINTHISIAVYYILYNIIYYIHIDFATEIHFVAF